MSSAPEKIVPRCGDCIAFVKSTRPRLPDLSQPGNVPGSCHLNPPQLVGVSIKTAEGPAIMPGGGFPEVEASWWCCRFMPRSKGAPATGPSGKEGAPSN